jgi:succinyl-diaminopimelate desuccinylase
MKVGTSASILTYLYLRRLGAPLKGKLTLTVVSDEETFGPYGARYLFEACPERITGTACLNGEPSSQYTVRFGEKGAVWLRFTITTPGGHGAFHHLSPNAIELAYPLINDLREFTKFQFQEPSEVVEALEAAREQMDKANGAGGGAHRSLDHDERGDDGCRPEGQDDRLKMPIRGRLSIAERRDQG